MENFSYHVPFYVVTGGVATTGHSSELTAGQVGLIDRQTWSVTTSAGNGKEFFFAQGNIGGKDWYGNSITSTHKSPYFLAKDVKNIYKSLPAKIVNEEWVVGYDGSASSVGLTFEKGKSTKVKFYFYGEPIYRKFAGPKEYVVSYTPDVDCISDECDKSCGPDALDPRPHVIAMINKINNHPELKNFGVTAKLKSSSFVAATPTMNKWSLSVCDTGDAIALQAVKAQYPSYSITRTARTGSTSTYQLCTLITNGTPAAFLQSASIAQSVCAVCPTGSTLTAGYDVYYVERSLAGTEDLSTSNLKQTYADTIGTAYKKTNTFSGTVSAVDVATDSITIAAHGLTTGTKVTYSNGGGTSITGIVTATDYFVIAVDANTVKLATTYANAIALTPIDLTVVGVGAAHTLKTVITSKFLQQANGLAKIELKVPTGFTVTALLGDVASLNYSSGANCVFPAPASIAWTNIGTGISSSRVLKTKLARPDCNASGDRLAELTTFLGQFSDITIGSLTKIAGQACVDEYTVTQISNDCLDEGCLVSNATFTYNTIPSLDNAVWEQISEASYSGVADTSVKAGIVITAGYIDPRFGNCSFNPFDYYNEEPVRFEISLFNEGAGNCTYANLATVYQTRKGVIGRQSGEYVVREVLMKTQAYIKHVDQFSPDPRMREAFDQNLLDMVDRKAYYVLYYVTFNANYNGLERKNEQEKFTAMFAVKESDTAQFDLEAGPLQILQAKSGVALHVNS